MEPSRWPSSLCSRVMLCATHGRLTALALRRDVARREATRHTWHRGFALPRSLVCLLASSSLAARALRRARRSAALAAMASPVMERPRSMTQDGQARPGGAGQKRRPYQDTDLPIQKILPSVLHHCRSGADLVLQAPTGAGKTTVVPLALLDSGLVEGKIIVLQPRRITCISVAKRMAELWGDALGETVGYRIRHECIVSNRTQIEVVTEGVLVRHLALNPELEGIGCICFDEFHERSIESDLSFALCAHLKRQRRLRARLLIMSATFGNLTERVADLLDNAQTLISEGRCFPVEVFYRPVLKLKDWEPQGPHRFADLVAQQVEEALEEHPGDVLVFVPGEREIMYVWIALNNKGIGDGQRPKNLVPWAHRLIDNSKVDLSRKIQVSPLYGTMETHEQDSVLQAKEGWRKGH
ncbi:unnamed protein product [Durusdinium trenchii]|uniref:Helicase ATP-binding domain-containing protein n=1 Tax=Durusdinium trenchii TaxID=1381693 RepID=A0ABP0QFM6_9DINO